MTVFFGAVVALTTFGFVFLFLDVRRWWRSLGRALVLVANYLPAMPAWGAAQHPGLRGGAGFADALHRGRGEAGLPGKGQAAAPRSRRRPAALSVAPGTVRVGSAAGRFQMRSLTARVAHAGAAAGRRIPPVDNGGRPVATLFLSGYSGSLRSGMLSASSRRDGNRLLPRRTVD